MKTLNGYEIVDEQAREDISGLGIYYLNLTSCTESFTNAPEDVAAFADAYIARGTKAILYAQHHGQIGYMPMDVTYATENQLQLRTTMRMHAVANGTPVQVHNYTLLNRDGVWQWKVRFDEVYLATAEEGSY